MLLSSCSVKKLFWKLLRNLQESTSKGAKPSFHLQILRYIFLNAVVRWSWFVSSIGKTNQILRNINLMMWTLTSGKKWFYDMIVLPVFLLFFDIVPKNSAKPPTKYHNFNWKVIRYTTSKRNSNENTDCNIDSNRKKDK